MIATAEQMETGLVHDMPAETYHQRTLGVASKSALDQINRSPAHYRAWLIEDQQPTPAMRFGSLFHRYVLELPKALATIAVVPDFGDCRKTANKEAKAQWHAENDGKDFVSQEDWDTIRYMGDSIHKHPIAAKLLAACKAEVSMKWIDAETGLHCKSRVDGIVEPMDVLIDVKTTQNASPEEFAKSAFNFRYHVQAALYSDGYEAVTGRPAKRFRLIAVEKEPPYAVMTHDFGQAELDLGRESYKANMRTLAECLERDEWPAYGITTNTITFPQWAFNRRNS